MFSRILKSQKWYCPSNIHDHKLLRGFGTLFFHELINFEILFRIILEDYECLWECSDYPYYAGRSSSALFHSSTVFCADSSTSGDYVMYSLFCQISFVTDVERVVVTIKTVDDRLIKENLRSKERGGCGQDLTSLTEHHCCLKEWQS